MNTDFAFGNHQKGIDAKAGQSQSSATHYQHALNIDGHNNSARMNLAHLNYRQQRFDEAERLYRKTLSQEPDAAPALYALGLLVAERGNLTEAESLLERAALNGSNPRAWYNLAVLRHQQQKFETAIAAYREAIALDPLNIDFLQGLVSLFAQRQQWDEADAVVANSLTLAPNHRPLLQLQQALIQARQ